MNTITQSAQFLSDGKPVAQGDVRLVPCDEIPEDLTQQAPESGRYVLAHSETGHHHALAVSDDVTVYDQDEFISYVENRGENVVELRHLRNFDTHGPIGIPPGKFRVVRQREYTPEGYRRAAD